MICPVCLNEIADQSICEVCGAELEQDFSKDKDITWVIVYFTNVEIQAQMVKAYLADSGIPAVIESMVDSWLPLPSPKAVAKVFVPEHYVDEAKKLITHYEYNQNQDEQ